MTWNSPATTGELSEHVSTKLHAYVRKRQPSSFSRHRRRGIAGIGMLAYAYRKGYEHCCVYSYVRTVKGVVYKVSVIMTTRCAVGSAMETIREKHNV